MKFSTIKSDSGLFKLMDALYKHGPFTFDEGMKIHGFLYKTCTPSRTFRLYEASVKSGRILCRDEIYSLSVDMFLYFDDLYDVKRAAPLLVQPRTPNIFRELPPSKIPSAKGTRPEVPPHDYGYLTSGTSPEPFRGVV